jgi:choline monooxygenase
VFGDSSLQSCPLSGSANSAMAWYWHLWPGWMVNLYGDVADTNRVLPDGVGRCRVLFDWFARGDCPPERVAAIVASSDQVQQEDMQICEEVQSNLSTCFYHGGPYVPRREVAGWRFHQKWAEVTGFKGFGGNDG